MCSFYWYQNEDLHKASSLYLQRLYSCHVKRNKKALSKYFFLQSNERELDNNFITYEMVKIVPYYFVLFSF